MVREKRGKRGERKGNRKRGEEGRKKGRETANDLLRENPLEKRPPNYR